MAEIDLVLDCIEPEQIVTDLVAVMSAVYLLLDMYQDCKLFEVVGLIFGARMNPLSMVV